jgi:hypothetical protein
MLNPPILECKMKPIVLFNSYFLENITFASLKQFLRELSLRDIITGSEKKEI